MLGLSSLPGLIPSGSTKQVFKEAKKENKKPWKTKVCARFWSLRSESWVKQVNVRKCQLALTCVCESHLVSSSPQMFNISLVAWASPAAFWWFSFFMLPFILLFLVDLWFILLDLVIAYSGCNVSIRALICNLSSPLPASYPGCHPPVAQFFLSANYGGQRTLKSLYPWCLISLSNSINSCGVDLATTSWKISLFFLCC